MCFAKGTEEAPFKSSKNATKFKILSCVTNSQKTGNCNKERPSGIV
jgi:pyocin large subunit-like protein